MGKKGSSTLGFRGTQDPPLLLLPDNRSVAAEANPDPTMGGTGLLHIAWLSQKVKRMLEVSISAALGPAGIGRGAGSTSFIRSLTYPSIQPLLKTQCQALCWVL